MENTGEINNSQNIEIDSFLKDLRQKVIESQNGELLGVINNAINFLTNKGIEEIDAIRMVVARIIPKYAKEQKEIELLKEADACRDNWQQLLRCSYTWCRHNAIILEGILRLRGYQPYRVSITWQNGGGHQMSAIEKDKKSIYFY